MTESRVTLDSEEAHGWYESFLPVNKDNVTKQPRLVHFYRNVAASFAARLTAEEAKDMKEKNRVLSVQPETILIVFAYNQWQS